MPFIIAFSRKGMTFRTFTCETQTWWVQSYPSPSPSFQTAQRPTQHHPAAQLRASKNVKRDACGTKDRREWPPRKMMENAYLTYAYTAYIYILWPLSGQGSVLYSDEYLLIMSLPFRSTSSNHAHTTMYKFFWGVLPGFLSRATGRPVATFDIMEQQHVQRGASRLIICQRETCRQICHVRKNLHFMKICVRIPRKRTCRQSRLRNFLGRKVLNTSPPAWIGFAFEDVWGVYWDTTTINHLFGWGRTRSIELTQINIRWTFECIRVFGEEQFFIDGDIQKCQPTRVEVVSGHHTWPERNERNNLTMW